MSLLGVRLNARIRIDAEIQVGPDITIATYLFESDRMRIDAEPISYNFDYADDTGEQVIIKTHLLFTLNFRSLQRAFSTPAAGETRHLSDLVNNMLSNHPISIIPFPEISTNLSYKVRLQSRSITLADFEKGKQRYSRAITFRTLDPISSIPTIFRNQKNITLSQIDGS